MADESDEGKGGLEDLDYETSLAQYRGMYYGTKSPAIDDPFVIQGAQGDHALKVWNPLHDAFIEAVNLSSRLKNENAQAYMRFGAGQRLNMIWNAYRHIVLTIPPEREEPLQTEETHDLNLDLNTIYMNLRGVLDNFAWALLFEKDAERAEIANRTKRGSVGLFLPSILGNSAFSQIAPKIEEHSIWNDEIKERRDPVAHRIPLAIPPSTVNSEEARQYQETYDSYVKAGSQREFDQTDSLLKQLDSIGKFVPVFVHHPADGVIPLYPILPTDMAHLVKISRTVFSFLADH